MASVTTDSCFVAGLMMDSTDDMGELAVGEGDSDGT